MADETGKSDVLNPYGLNPNSGKPMPWARESLADSLLPNRWAIVRSNGKNCWSRKWFLRGRGTVRQY